jgi:hypothetical protein
MILRGRYRQVWLYCTPVSWMPRTPLLHDKSPAWVRATSTDHSWLDGKSGTGRTLPGSAQSHPHTTGPTEIALWLVLEFCPISVYSEPRISGHRWDKHFRVLISEGPYKQPRITKNNFGRDMLWGVPISRIAQVVGRRLLDREVRGSNPSHDIMALLLGRHYEFPHCGIIKEKLLLLIIIIIIVIIIISECSYIGGPYIRDSLYILYSPLRL